MKLMRLSPLAQRLRRVARAYAAGESTIEEYRQARRVILAELGRPVARKLDDTHRRGDVTTWLKPASAATPMPGVSSPGARSRGQRPSRPRLRWLVAVLGAVVALLWAVMRS